MNDQSREEDIVFTSEGDIDGSSGGASSIRKNLHNEINLRSTAFNKASL